MKTPENGKLLRIFIGESDRWQHRLRAAGSRSTLGLWSKREEAAQGLER